VGRAGQRGSRFNPVGLETGPSRSVPGSRQISYRQGMQSHDCRCFLPMTSSLPLQPYHPRKDASKIFGIGLDDVALQVSDIILQNSRFAGCSRAAVLEPQLCWAELLPGNRAAPFPCAPRGCRCRGCRLASPGEILPDEPESCGSPLALSSAAAPSGAC